MDGEREIDAALDRELESLLGVEPSPEFVARVRTRVAQEPEPGRWRSSWMFALAGAVAVVIIAVVVWPSREPSTARDAPVPSPRVAEGVETVAPPARSPVLQPRPLRQQATARPVAFDIAPARGIDIDLPEVVIADNEVATFAALVASIRQSRFDAAVPAMPNPDTPLEIKELPPVELLEIEPIVRVAALQAEGERP